MKKKRYSRLSGKLCCILCQFLVLTGNWQFFCCDGKFSLRPEKKEDTVVCLAGARSITTGKKRYSRLSVGCAVLAITRKKKIHYDRKKKDTVVCLMVARFWRLRPERKRYSRLSVGCAVLAIMTEKKKDTVEKKIHYDRKKKDTVVCLLGARIWRL